MACSFNKKGNYIAEEKTQLAVLLVGWDQNSIRTGTICIGWLGRRVFDKS
jgi:hypothetical protein